MTEKSLPRPRQVTTATVLAVGGSLLLVLSLVDTLGRLRTADARRSIEEILAEPPADELGLGVEGVLQLMRGMAFVSGALAAVTLVLAVFVAQRHRGARVGFTVAAGLLLLTLPVAGFLPLMILLAAVLMWSRPARDWYAGRAAATGTGTGTARPSADRPDSPPATSPVWPVPAATPSRGPAGDPDTTVAALPPPSPSGFGYPTSYATSGAHPYSRPHRRPATVTVAAVLTWLGAGLVALGTLVLMTLLARDTNVFVREYEQAARGSTVQLTTDQILAIGWALAAVLLLWCLVATLLAIFALRRSQAARIGLAVSAALTAALSLVGILSVVALLPLILAGAVLVLLFTGGANDWYARRSPRSSSPSSQLPGQPLPQTRQREKPW